MNRRVTLVGIATVLTAGCSTVSMPGDDVRSGVIEALAVEEKPPDAEFTAREDVANPFIQKALENVCENGERETTVRATGGDIEAVANELRGLPSYSPPNDSEYEYGNYVECDGQYAVVRLLIED